jgi:hypothetical protein
MSIGQKDLTCKVETAHQHALENCDEAMQVVHALELKLEIME